MFSWKWARRLSENYIFAKATFRHFDWHVRWNWACGKQRFFYSFHIARVTHKANIGHECVSVSVCVWTCDAEELYKGCPLSPELVCVCVSVWVFVCQCVSLERRMRDPGLSPLSGPHKPTEAHRSPQRLREAYRSVLNGPTCSFCHQNQNTYKNTKNHKNKP